MALSASDSLASFGQTTGKLDISPVLATVLLYDTALLGLIGVGEPALRADHRFNEDKLNAYFVTGDTSGTALDAAGNNTAIILIAGDGAKIRVGSLLRNQAVGIAEVLQVTAISVDTLTVTRNYQSAFGSNAHSKTALWTIIGQPVQEGDETINDISRARGQITQYTQIFKRTVKISGTMQAETANGMHPGVPDEAKYQILHRTLEMKRELNIAAIQSVLSSVAGSNTVYRTMRGLKQYLTAPPQSGAGAGTSLSDAEPLSEAIVNKMYRKAWDQGGDPRDLVGGPDQITRFADFNAGKVRVAASERIAGVFIEKYLTQFGAELSLTLDRWFSSDEVALIDKSRCNMALLQGRGLIVEPLAKIGDAQRWQVLMEAALVVKNADLAHCYHTGLTVVSA